MRTARAPALAERAGGTVGAVSALARRLRAERIEEARHLLAGVGRRALAVAGVGASLAVLGRPADLEPRIAGEGRRDWLAGVDLGARLRQLLEVLGDEDHVTLVVAVE